MSVSPEPTGCLYLTQVRYAGGVREHVADTERDSFEAAYALAERVKRWLCDGAAWGVPDAALDLHGELEAAGIDPASAEVEVVELDPTGPGRWDCAGRVVRVVDRYDAHGDDDPGGDGSDVDTVLLPAVGLVGREGR